MLIKNSQVTVRLEIYRDSKNHTLELIKEYRDGC